MTTLRLLLADQLSHSISSLNDLDTDHDILMLCEVMEEATYVKHHKLKIAFLFSAMRHFAEELRHKKLHLHYVKLDDSDNTGSFDTEVVRAIKKYNITRLIVTEPGEYRVLEKFVSWQKNLNIHVEIRTDDRFFCSRQDFAQWAKGKKQLRMENFYRTMRQRYSILLNNDKTPSGGKWNYDTENRKALNKNMRFPKRIAFPHNPIVKNVLQLVEAQFPDHFGNLDAYYFANTREQALELLDNFITQFLPYFGDYQDAMTKDDAFLFHSVLSPYLNAGLLLPTEVCKRAEAAYHEKLAPLNAVEGFIRQILGWREYIRGVYWLKMPSYATENFFHANNKLPDFYWSAQTDMNCLHTVISQTKEFAYSHHIQRLMISGNFALLAGILPEEVCAWYLMVYADAYEWVELPNTLGMALYGDGGFLASKPYAASGKYIHKMSNFCNSCVYNPKETIGTSACPFNSLYWHFLARNKAVLQKNPRLHFTYATWEKMSKAKQDEIYFQAETFLTSLK